jgi:hypothetical protein
MASITIGAAGQTRCFGHVLPPAAGCMNGPGRDMVNTGESATASVLVPEAHALGMLAAIRALGRAGYRVHAASPQRDAIGFASRYCGQRTPCPPFASPTYVEWLRRYIVEHDIRAVIPGGAFLLAIEPWFEEFRHLLPIARERATVYRAFSKVEVFEAFRQAPAELRLLDHHPASLVLAANGPLPKPDELSKLGTELYLKADARHGRPGSDDLLAGPLTPAQAVEAVARALASYGRVLVQGAVTGRQAGVSLLMGESGAVLAQNAFQDAHLEPTRRGTMSLRRSWSNAVLIEDAIRRLRHLGWQGAAMLEYRVRDGDESFDFIELNPRYWQSLHLDLLMGVDFPRLQLAWFEGRTVSSLPPSRDVICGDLWPGEISRMLEIWRSTRFSSAQRRRETLAFLLRLFDPRVASDYAFPGDRLVYWHRMMQVIGTWLRPRS